jgi:hypothetical protein
MSLDQGVDRRRNRHDALNCFIVLLIVMLSITHQHRLRLLYGRLVVLTTQKSILRAVCHCTAVFSRCATVE